MRYAFYNKPAGVVIYFVTPGRPCCPSIPRQLDIARPPVIRLSLADKSINNSCRGSISWPLSPRSSLAIVPFLNRNLDQNHTAREVNTDEHCPYFSVSCLLLDCTVVVCFGLFSWTKRMLRRPDVVLTA